MQIRSTDLKLMANAIDKIHMQLTILRGHVEASGCLDSLELFNNTDRTITAQLRALRKSFGIPYGADDA